MNSCIVLAHDNDVSTWLHAFFLSPSGQHRARKKLREIEDRRNDRQCEVSPTNLTHIAHNKTRLRLTNNNDPRPAEGRKGGGLVGNSGEREKRGRVCRTLALARSRNKESIRFPCPFPRGKGNVAATRGRMFSPDVYPPSLSSPVDILEYNLPSAGITVKPTQFFRGYNVRWEKCHLNASPFTSAEGKITRAYTRGVCHIFVYDRRRETLDRYRNSYRNSTLRDL